MIYKNLQKLFDQFYKNVKGQEIIDRVRRLAEGLSYTQYFSMKLFSPTMISLQNYKSLYISL